MVLRSRAGPEFHARLTAKHYVARNEATILTSARDAALAEVSRVTADRDVARADATRLKTESDAARVDLVTSAQALQSARAELVDLRARALTPGGSSSQPGSSATAAQLTAERRTV